MIGITMVKIAKLVLDLFKKVSCQILVVVVQFRQVNLKKQTRYKGETLHDDWNP